jgi:TolB-like protein
MISFVIILAKGASMKILMRIVASVSLLFFILPSIAAEESLSVLYFNNTSGNKEYAWLGKGIADMLITDFVSAGTINIVEREELEKILNEQELALSGLFSEANAPKIGGLLKAGKLVFGSFIIQNKEIRIDAKIVDAANAKVAGSARSKGKLESIFELEKDLSTKLWRALGFEAPSTQSQETSSLDAAKAYYQGLDLYDSGKLEAALSQFEKASAIDPFYSKPLQSIEESYKFLKDFKKMQKQREISKLLSKATALKKRLEAKTFISYADVVMDPEQYGFKKEDVAKLPETNPELLSGDTPAQVTWNLVMTIDEIADKSDEYFGETDKAKAMYTESLAIINRARKQFAKDNFLPEILYQELFCFRYLGMWNEMKAECEYFMTELPDFRMMFAIEDFYEMSLEKLKKTGEGEK